MTTDIDLTVGNVPIPKTNVIVDLFLYDIPGQNVFNEERELQSSVWDGARCIICCYDISSRESFENCSKWIQSVALANETAQVLLVANKVDLREDRKYCVEVDTNEGKKYAESHGYDFFECSAVGPVNSKLPFEHVANRIYQEEFSDD
ncbi:hypothetical protein ACHAXR_007536 [Thalassiosira sp. AJA248-18]